MWLNTSIRAARSSSPAAQSYLEVSNFVRACLRSRTCPRTDVRQRRGYVVPNGIAPNFVDRCKETISFPRSTCEIKDIPHQPDGKVTLHGYIGPKNILSQKRLCFAPLLSQTLDHSVQIVSSTTSDSNGDPGAHQTLLSLTPNSPVVVTGILRERKAKPATEQTEVVRITSKELDLLSIQPLNFFPKDVVLADDTKVPPEKRYLQLRHQRKLREALKFRAAVAEDARTLLASRGFIEIETPLLFKSTPEGAREFIVPTRQKGLVYSLPQSPQQFKQVLMAGGLPKYFQLARCFRDEDLRADRQPEFTQIDVEMAFATGEDVLELTENLIKLLWERHLPNAVLPAPFPRMTYAEAMGRYGSDKPDLRVDGQIHRIEYLLPVDLIAKISDLSMPAVDAFHLPLGSYDSRPVTSQEFVGGYLECPDGELFVRNPHGGPGIFIFDSSKPLQGLQSLGFEAAEALESMFDLHDGDLLVLQARPDTPFSGGSTMAGNLRLGLFSKAVEQGLIPAPTGFAPLWVTDFPLFSPISEDEPGQGGLAGLTATHHPFTSPKSPDDVDLLFTEPEKAIGDHYDLVINGSELGGGSRRIHDAEMQHLIMEHILRMPALRIAEFDHLLDALRTGCPPHAGIALGFDRLIAIMLGYNSVREVMAFPKWGDGNDLFVKSPSPVTEDTLKTYHLKLRE